MPKRRYSNLVSPLRSPPGLRRVRRRSTFLTAAAVRGAALRRAARFGSYGLGAYSAYTVGRGAMRMVRRKKKAFSPRNFGERVGTSTAKRAVTDDTEIINRDTRTLYNHSALDIPFGTALNQRERNIANVRGIKLCMEVKSLSNEPLYINVAMLAPKDGVNAVTTDNFFRSSDDTARARDFDISMNSNEFHCLAINTDKYTILKHKRMRLIPQGAGTTTTVSLNGYSYFNLNWWIPLKRQIRWNAGTNQPVSGEVQLVYWADQFHTAANTTPLVGQFSVMRRCVAYFKEPKN